MRKDFHLSTIGSVSWFSPFTFDDEVNIVICLHDNIEISDSIVCTSLLLRIKGITRLQVLSNIN